ncbi:MAG: nuclease [Microgenomates group bacterium Gr01-1014_80]|nr:MAG: nuclease [Microgenomates group bacterium Gr01-1014_80]
MTNPRLLTAFVIVAVVLGSSILFGLNPGKQSPKPLPSPTSPTVNIEGEKALVTKVIDGDTIKVSMVGKEVTVRILGVDTPETVDLRKSVQCFGKEASHETKKLLDGQQVILQKDVSDKDKYDRLLRYVFLPLGDGDTLFISDYLIREGYAHTLTIPPDVKYADQFLRAQRQAREAKKGLWGKC